jgi:glycosyltransferase involved in cell wall biosynthesis
MRTDLVSATLPPRAPAVAERPLTVCKVWDSEYPWDVRVEKIAQALTDAGHDVHLVARNRRGEAVTERLSEATIHRLTPWQWAGSRLSAASMFPAFFNPRWVRAVRRTARQVRADVILCRDLPLAVPAIVAARHLGIPVVLDLAENYVAMLRSRWEAGRMRASDALVRNPALASLVERWVVPRVDHVLVVVEEAGARLVARGLAPERVTVVSNTPPLKRLVESRLHSRGDGDDLRLVYLGLMEEPRGVRILLEAAALLARRGVGFRLVLYGDGPELSDFRAHARALGLADTQADFRGHVPNAQALAALPLADVGVIPHFADESWHTTVPNKLFDYMAAGLAVVTSDARPAARIIHETAAGLVYRHPDPAALADAIERLADHELRRACAERGRAAVRDTYHWERDVARLLEVLARVAAVRAPDGLSRRPA